VVPVDSPMAGLTAAEIGILAGVPAGAPVSAGLVRQLASEYRAALSELAELRVRAGFVDVTQLSDPHPMEMCRNCGAVRPNATGRHEPGGG